MNIEDEWNDIKESNNRIRVEVLGNKIVEYKEWIISELRSLLVGRGEKR